MRLSLGTTLLLTTCAAVAAFCSPTAADGVNVPTGTWGGQHIALEVTAAGATVEFDCAHGAINGPLTLDSSGQFDLTGTFAREHGGPIRDDDSSTGEPARYSGTLKDGTLTVTVTLTERSETVGTFTLKRDTPARLLKCR
jgi:hypothetical protein